MITGVVIVVVVVVVLVAVVLEKALKVVQQGSVEVVKRLREFKSVRQPGIAFLVPFFDQMGRSTSVSSLAR